MKTEECQSALTEVAPELRAAYASWKEWESCKNEHKDRFFELADKAIEVEHGLAVTMTVITAQSESAARERAERFHPTWFIEELRSVRARPGTYEVVLKENPAYQPYTFEHEGWKISRRVSKGTVMLDEAWLLEEDSELFLECCFELPWGQVVVKPITAMEPEVLAKLKKYLYNDKPRVALAPPTQIKEES